MSYTTIDFSESLARVKIPPGDISTVVAAWGHGSGMGTDSGLGWSQDGVTDWAGGFLLHMANGRYAYVWGWCDWGCQDGAEVRWFDHPPSRELLAGMSDEYSRPRDWDDHPADLNRWLENGAKDPWDD